MREIIFENAVNALFLDAFPAAAGAVLTELHRGIFTDGRKTRIRRFGMNMIFFGHTRLQKSLWAGKKSSGFD
jgi:hypothetical protein